MPSRFFIGNIIQGKTMVSDKTEKSASLVLSIYKAQKGTPQYDKWLAAYKAKRGSTYKGPTVSVAGKVKDSVLEETKEGRNHLVKETGSKFSGMKIHKDGSEHYVYRRRDEDGSRHDHHIIYHPSGNVSHIMRHGHEGKDVLEYRSKDMEHKKFNSHMKNLSGLGVGEHKEAGITSHKAEAFDSNLKAHGETYQYFKNSHINVLKSFLLYNEVFNA